MMYVRLIFEILGALNLILSLLLLTWGIVSWLRGGILRVVINLGHGLAERKVALFAKGDNISELKALLTDSKLFRAENIIEITKEGSIDRAMSASIYLVCWPDWSVDYKKILDQKTSTDALVVYAPHSGGKIPNEVMKELDLKSNTAVGNYRGRALNDLVTAMITTAYQQK